MIVEEKTVFVLGAGASVPYGYPTGKKLADAIHNMGSLKSFLDDINPSFHRERTSSEINELLGGYKKFQEHFLKSGINSIDRFVKDNQEYKYYAKSSIAYLFNEKEDEKALFNMDDSDKWYRTLWNSIDHSIEKFEKNNIHFITFNYDRSLEHFLFTAMYNKYSGKKSIDVCKQAISKINIIHVYGCIAPLDWQDKSGLAYTKKDLSYNNYQYINDNLFLMGDERESVVQENYRKITDTLKDAKNIYFLGFGFDIENMNILGTKYVKAENILCTAYALPKTMEADAKEVLMNKCTNSKKETWVKEPQIVFINTKINDFIENNIILK